MKVRDDLDLAGTYRAAFGHDPNRSFQVETAREIASSGALILRAPTGSGKTRAALLAPLAAWRTGNPLVDRVIYAVPLRSLAFSLADEARAAVLCLGLDLRVTVQIGGSEEDPLFDRGHIIFTTIDQLLSRYLSIPYSLGAGRANMCPGALVGAYIVLDEVHLLDGKRALPTSLVMLGIHFRNVTRFLVMSATLSKSSVASLGKILTCRTRCVEPDEAAGWSGFADIQRTLEVRNEPLDAGTLLGIHRELPRRMLVVVNTVKRAQALHGELHSMLGQDAEVILLHSRFLPTDRKVIEQYLPNLLGKSAVWERRPRILVATQVVEVGLDLSADVLHTELAPASALVQRFGRCARWPGERGRIFVHDSARDESGVRQLGPYRDQKTLIESTWTCLVEATKDGPLKLDAFVANQIVDRVHAAVDQTLFDSFSVVEQERPIARAIDDGEVAQRRELIRDVNSVSVLVRNLEPPGPAKIAEWVSVPRSSLYSLPAADAWTYDFGDETQSMEGGWHREALGSGLVSRALLLALPPAVASYTPQAGLVLGVAGDETPLRIRVEKERPRFGYQSEGWLDHAMRVLRVGMAMEQTRYEVPEINELRPGMAKGLEALDEQIGSIGLTAKLCRLAAVLHDVGKLARPWQNWASEWQVYVTGQSPNGPLAHTDFDPHTHRPMELQFRQRGKRRPPHAVASALACEDLVENLVDDIADSLGDQERTNLTDAVLSAIGRHHAPRAESDCAFLPADGVQHFVGQALTAAGLPSQASELKKIDGSQMGRFKDIVVQLGQEGDRGGRKKARQTMLVYWVVVRYLRTADGHSQALARVEEC